MGFRFVRTYSNETPADVDTIVDVVRGAILMGATHLAMEELYDEYAGTFMSVSIRIGKGTE